MTDTATKTPNREDPDYLDRLMDEREAAGLLCYSVRARSNIG